MTFIAVHSSLAAAFLDGFYFDFEVPGLAIFRQILIILGIPAVVLEIMGIGAVTTIMSNLWRAYSWVYGHQIVL
jgi:hypothetical protein